MKRLLQITLGVCLLIAPATRADVYVDNVVIVLDASGSMKESFAGTQKMAGAKQAIAEVLATVPETTQVGLLVFSGVGKKSDWVFPLGPRDDQTLLQGLNAVKPSGGTPLGKYIKTGADRLLEVRDRQLGYGSYRMLIVTDGQANDPELVTRHAPEVIERGIIVDVIGVAMKSSHILAQKAHSYRTAKDPESLRKAIGDVMAEVVAQGAGGGEAAFEELEGIPDEVALAMIGALGNPSNDPIGLGKVQAAVEDGHGTQTVRPKSGKTSKRRSPVAIFMIIAVVYVVAQVVIKKAKR